MKARVLVRLNSLVLFAAIAELKTLNFDERPHYNCGPHNMTVEGDSPACEYFVITKHNDGISGGEGKD